MRASGFSLLLVGARERWFGKGVTANAIARGTPSGRAVRLFIVWEAQLSESSFGLLADPLTEGKDSHKYLCTDIISHDVVVALSSSRQPVNWTWQGRLSAGTRVCCASECTRLKR